MRFTFGRKAIWQLFRDYSERVGIRGLAPHDVRRRAPNCTGRQAATSSKFSYCSGTRPFRRPSAISARSKISRMRRMIELIFN